LGKMKNPVRLKEIQRKAKNRQGRRRQKTRQRIRQREREKILNLRRRVMGWRARHGTRHKTEIRGVTRTFTGVVGDAEGGNFLSILSA
jgi:hypothetical protein